MEEETPTVMMPGMTTVENGAGARDRSDAMAPDQRHSETPTPPQRPSILMAAIVIPAIIDL